MAQYPFGWLGRWIYRNGLFLFAAGLAWFASYAHGAEPHGELEDWLAWTRFAALALAFGGAVALLRYSTRFSDTGEWARGLAGGAACLAGSAALSGSLPAGAIYALVALVFSLLLYLGWHEHCTLKSASGE